MPQPLQFALKLPRGYSPADAFRFHGRDAQGISESVRDGCLRKAILLDQTPALFEIDFASTPGHAVCTVHADGAMTEAMQQQAQGIVDGLIGLRLDPRQFARLVAADPVFGPLTQRQKQLRIIQASSLFEALTWAIMGQQINVAFAVTLRRSFVQLAGQPHSSGLLCYPSAADAAQLPLEALTSRQFSRAKGETILRLAQLLASGALDLTPRPERGIAAICQDLLAIKGIGPWTVNYALLRGFGHADCSLHGDVAVRTAIGRLWQHAARPDIASAEVFLRQYAPHRTMAAAHLWASLNSAADF